MPSDAISYEFALFLTQVIVALAIIVLAVAAKTTRHLLEQRLQALEVLALRASSSPRRGSETSDEDAR